ncbi:MAG: DUF11 domain-containing protein, partial [Candidatus Thorarchaeota archaeon]
MTIVDTLDVGLTFDSASVAPDSVVGQVITWTVPGIDCTWLRNDADFDYWDVNDNFYGHVDDWEDVHVITPVMTFWKEVDKTEVGSGDYLTYTLYYMNTGHATACDVVIVDTLPDGVTFVSSDPDYYSINGQVITWKVGNVEPSDTAGEITITVRVNQFTFCHDLINSATLDYFDRNQNAYPTLDDEVVSHTILQTWITDTSECRLPVTDFRVVFTPDLKLGPVYKISSTNPGSFYFNILF